MSLRILRDDQVSIRKSAREQEAKSKDKRREAVMREFVGEYGKGVRQENVRSKTKELTGTLHMPSACVPLSSQPHRKTATT